MFQLRLPANNFILEIGEINTILYKKGKGIIFCEPTVLGVVKGQNKEFYFGKEVFINAKENPTITPLKTDSLKNETIILKIVQWFFKKGYFNKRKTKKICLTLSLPCFFMQNDYNYFKEKINKIKNLQLCNEISFLAIGLYQKTKTFPLFILNTQKTYSSAAVIEKENFIFQEISEIGTKQMQEKIINYLKTQHNLIIKKNTAKNLLNKLIFSTNNEGKETNDKLLHLKGRDLFDGLPKAIAIYNSEIVKELYLQLDLIVKLIGMVLENSSKEILKTILQNGIVLIGDLSNLQGVENYLQSKLKLPVKIFKKHEKLTLVGMEQFFKNKSIYKNLFYN